MAMPPNHKQMPEKGKVYTHMLNNILQFPNNYSLFFHNE